MSNYPIWWDSTITVYNKYTDPQTKVVVWFRTVLDGAFWKDTGVKVTVGNTVLETNDIICRVRKADNYKPYYEWVNIPNDKMGDYFTFQMGDIIVKDEVDDEINEYGSGTKSNDLLTKYKALQGCMKIDKVGDNTGAGRCNEHYYVKGV